MFILFHIEIQNIVIVLPMIFCNLAIIATLNVSANFVNSRRIVERGEKKERLIFRLWCHKVLFFLQFY